MIKGDDRRLTAIPVVSCYNEIKISDHGAQCTMGETGPLNRDLHYKRNLGLAEPPVISFQTPTCQHLRVDQGKKSRKVLEEVRVKLGILSIKLFKTTWKDIYL